jgi:glycosyltransferase involved in cell wall biosynthesis
MPEDIEFSIIMPALNEEKNIGFAILNSLESIDQFGLSGELIVINDGSTDNTAALIKSYMERDPRVRLIIHPQPMGVGASFWDGVEQARGKFVVMLPGDNENDPMEILRYHALLESVDIVIPFVFNKEVRSPFRNSISFIYQFIINTTFFVNFNYTNGTVLYRKALLDELEFRSASFFFQTDILVRLAKRNYLYAEVPYCLGSRSQWVSKAVSLSSLLKVIRGYLRLLLDIYGPARAKASKSHFASSRTAQRYRECENLDRFGAKFKL